jgi:hypothetical protein
MGQEEREKNERMVEISVEWTKMNLEEREKNE